MRGQGANLATLHAATKIAGKMRTVNLIANYGRKSDGAPDLQTAEAWSRQSVHQKREK